MEDRMEDKINYDLNDLGQFEDCEEDIMEILDNINTLLTYSHYTQAPEDLKLIKDKFKQVRVLTDEIDNAFSDSY